MVLGHGQDIMLMNNASRVDDDWIRNVQVRELTCYIISQNFNN